MILAPSNPEKHLLYAERALRFGKLTYIDKTFAPDAATAARIFALGREHGAKLFSTSALRYAEELKAFDHPHCAFVSGGGRTLEEYSIHQIEMIVCLMGEGARSVTCAGDRGQAACAIEYEDGRRAALLYGAGMSYALDVQAAAGGDSAHVPVKSQFFPALLRGILSFYETGRVPVAESQTMACMKLRDAVLRAADNPGARVDV